MIRLVENFREFLDLAKINQGPDGWTTYGSNPTEDSIFAWHTSWRELEEFKNYPAWFRATPEDAEAGHKLNPGDHTYLVKITGNILSSEAAMEVANMLGINFDKLVIELNMNPSITERRELSEPFIKYCDGFIHLDEDPKNWGKGGRVESIFVFDPSQHVEIIEEINY